VQAKAQQRLTCEACTTLNEHERKRSANLEVGQKLLDEGESKMKLESEARSFFEISERESKTKCELSEKDFLRKHDSV